MPIYEFTCQSCRKDFELLLMGSGRDLRCPHCKGTHLTRQMSAFASGGTAKGGGSCSGCQAASCKSCG